MAPREGRGTDYLRFQRPPCREGTQAGLTLDAERLLNRTWLLGSTAMACEKNSMASSWFPALKAALPLACGCGVAAYGTDL